MGIENKTLQENGGLTRTEILAARGYVPRTKPTPRTKPSVISSERVIAEERAEVERIAREGRL